MAERLRQRHETLLMLLYLEIGGAQRDMLHQESPNQGDMMKEPGRMSAVTVSLQAWCFLCEHIFR